MAAESFASPSDDGVSQEIREPFRRLRLGDARDLRNLTAASDSTRLAPLADKSVDLIVTSPPYWRKRAYGIAIQIGQEKTAEEYVEQIIKAIVGLRHVFRPF